MSKEPLVVLVKMGESHAELVADLESYGTRARAGRLRNLALAGLLLQQQQRGNAPTPAPTALPDSPPDVRED